jgi:multiple sugar transport system permease protein
MTKTIQLSAGARPLTIPRKRFSATKWYRSGGLSAVLFGIPIILIFLYFSWGPIVQGMILSLQKTNLVAPAQWVGLSNFAYVLSDPTLPQAALNTVYFAVLALIVGFPIPILLAVFINELRRWDWLYNSLAYLPAVVPPVAAILLWKFFYDPSQSGIFNTMLGWFGVGPFPLGTVRTELYEAAEIDGARIWARIWHITLPQMRNIIFTMMLLQLIGTFQLFTEPFLFTGGGPNNATQTILLKIYNYAFVNGDYGAATALSVLLAVVLGLFSFAYYFVTKKWSSS